MNYARYIKKDVARRGGKYRFISDIVSSRKIKPALKFNLVKLTNFLVCLRLCKQQKEDIHFLCNHVRRIRHGGIVLEIGRKYGGSMILMCRANRNIKVYSLDIETKYKVFTAKLAKLFSVSRKQYRIITADSRKYTWNGCKIDLLFLDGWHFYKDIMRHSKYVRNGGKIIVNHPSRGSTQIINKFLSKNSNFRRHSKVGHNELLVRSR